MARVIYKYDLGGVPSALSDVTIEMKEGAEILYVANQHDRMVMWALVEEYADDAVRDFYLCWTGPGNTPPDNSEYVGTGIFQNGNYVLHVFEKEQRNFIN